jgi:hypothetical protein
MINETLWNQLLYLDQVGLFEISLIKEW